MTEKITTPTPAAEDVEALALRIGRALGYATTEEEDAKAARAALSWFAERTPQTTVSAEQVEALRERITDPAWRGESTAAQVEGVLHALDLRVAR